MRGVWTPERRNPQMAASVSADRPLLALAEALDAVDVAMRAGDTVPMSDEVRAELTDKWL